ALLVSAIEVYEVYKVIRRDLSEERALNRRDRRPAQGGNRLVTSPWRSRRLTSRSAGGRHGGFTRLRDGAASWRQAGHGGHRFRGLAGRNRDSVGLSRATSRSARRRLSSPPTPVTVRMETAFCLFR